jgi:hypothetical protein
MAPQTAEAANIIIPDDGVISPRAILGNIPLRLLSQRSDPRGALQLGAHFGCIFATGLLGPRATRHCRERPLPVLAAHPNAEGDPRQAEARAGSRAFAAAEGVRATAS